MADVGEAGFGEISSALPGPIGIPAYTDNVTYLAFGDRTIPWEFAGWQEESLSWKTGCYIHSGLSGWRLDLEGRDIDAFLSRLCANGFGKFAVGSMKHAVMCNAEGLVASHAILQRNGENLYRIFAAGYPWLPYQASISDLDIKLTPVQDFLFQVAGPTSLATLEAAAGESLKDIAFLRFRDAVIAGRRVEIARIGMSGNLAYEVRGKVVDGPSVYEAIYQVGQDFGLQRLGWRTYFVNHVEGGFPQAGWTFFSSAITDPGFQAFMGRPMPRLTGSVDPADLRARFRTPYEINWDMSVRFDHDFIGRDALEKEAANPHRRTVTLRWNPEDVLDVHASLLRPGAPYRTIDMPVTPSWRDGHYAHADRICVDGRDVGVASGTIYSFHFREVISMGMLDLDLTDIGREVIVHWGDHGGPIKPIRATVAAFPYIGEGRNSDVDTSRLA